MATGDLNEDRIAELIRKVRRSTRSAWAPNWPHPSMPPRFRLLPSTRSEITHTVAGKGTSKYRRINHIS